MSTSAAPAGAVKLKVWVEVLVEVYEPGHAAVILEVLYAGTAFRADAPAARRHLLPCARE
jgi:hypothetical protein